MNMNQSPDEDPLSESPSPPMDRRAFLLALSGSAFVLASGALLAGCGGGGLSNLLSSSSSNSESSSSSSDSLGSSSSSSSLGAFLYAGHYTGTSSLKLSDGSNDNGNLAFDVDNTGKLTGTYTDVTYGGSAPISGNVPLTGVGTGTLTSQNINGTGQFTVGTGGLITVSGTITGHNATGSLSIVTGNFSATTAPLAST
jgi:hypothetical protein